MFEDNDLCYRIRRAGYRLMFVQSSFVHHKGSASLDRSQVSRIDMFNQNLALYRRKWAMDMETGFVSQLAGLQGPRISFNETRRPESLTTKLAPKVKEANISLCMIVKNESRVLADCLRSAKPFFSQIIVVDTGSSDDTIQIAKEFGAEVVEFPWPESFALARNESLRYAKGDWVCWLDADDTLPFSSGEQIIDAVLNVPLQIGGLVMPIRFVNDDPEFGTQVDHVKVFRNRQGFSFEGRIHEQVLPSIREKGFDLRP
jgi:cellulose synthase/poly-beta-1,6-N-acetylglucosamine synthase-like glycosyltransferase